ncbi:Protein CBG27319 [Caenorhabditis briggsae]|uniref:Protein CBG27319 n=2 Tax=Caenorhabditis briggsae TaxID=6238 RepID=B6IG51_CAEBR|nr:Protein CBG27319 [Caenorhabditis briggsae]ULT92633.1 hypothetical protein L3Y34_010020 [Caenorhabditis briggsae]CAR98881.1 Protein CBG27319 [Caenorhabditis briggsae]
MTIESCKKQKPDHSVENCAFVTCLLFVISMICLGGAGIMLLKNDYQCHREIQKAIESTGCPTMSQTEAENNAFAARKRDVMLLAQHDRALMDKMYKIGLTTPVFEMKEGKTIQTILFKPDIVNFVGVDGLLQWSGNNRTLANFFYFARPNTTINMMVPEKVDFVLDGVDPGNFMIGECAYNNISCHTTELSFVGNDLQIVETFQSTFVELSIGRLFYVPVDDMIIARTHH